MKITRLEYLNGENKREKKYINIMKEWSDSGEYFFILLVLWLLKMFIGDKDKNKYLFE